MFSKLGGLFVGLNKVLAVIVLACCHLKFNSKLIAIINSGQINLNGEELTQSEVESKKKLKKLQDNNFQMRLACWKMCCCSSKRLGQRLFTKDEKIEEMN